MSPECPCSQSSSDRPRDESVQTKRRVAGRAGSLLGLLASVLAILAPKCPMCLAAYLSLFGLGALASWVAPALLPLGIFMGVTALAFLALGRGRRGRFERET